MAVCEICQKSASHGNKLSITRSHISKRSPRTWKPNLRRVKADVNGETITFSSVVLLVFHGLIFNSKYQLYNTS